MNEENKTLENEDLEQVYGGINWGPEDDAIVECKYCHTKQVIYKKDFPWNCRNCGKLLEV